MSNLETSVWQILSFDTENTSRNWVNNDLACCSLSAGKCVMPDARRSVGSVSCVMSCVGSGEIKFTISGEREEYSRNELLHDMGPFGPLSSKVIQPPEVRTISVAGWLASWLVMASASTWTMPFRDCRLQE